MSVPLVNGVLIRTSNKRMAQLCDRDMLYATLVFEGKFWRVSLPKFYENLGWDERAQCHYIVGVKAPC